MTFKLFTKNCACGEVILGPRAGGKARGEWLGYDTCTKCRAPNPQSGHSHDQA